MWTFFLIFLISVRPSYLWYFLYRCFLNGYIISIRDYAIFIFVQLIMQSKRTWYSYLVDTLNIESCHFHFTLRTSQETKKAVIDDEKKCTIITAKVRIRMLRYRINDEFRVEWQKCDEVRNYSDTPVLCQCNVLCQTKFAFEIIILKWLLWHQQRQIIYFHG